MKNFQTIAVILILLFIGSNSFACSCTGKMSVKEAVRNSDIVFGGKVLFVKPVDYLRWQGIPMVGKLVTLLVQEKAKGTIDTDTVIIATGSGGADCGVQFQEGHSYLVYAKSYSFANRINNDSVRYFYAGLCSRTGAYKQTELKKASHYSERLNKKGNSLGNVGLQPAHHLRRHAHRPAALRVKQHPGRFRLAQQHAIGHAGEAGIA